MRQQNLRCPFLVISGEGECYHNPSPLLLPLLASLLLLPVSYLTFSPQNDANVQLSCPTLYLCHFFVVFTGRCKSSLGTLPVSVASEKSGTALRWCLDRQARCARKSLGSSERVDFEVVGASLEPPR